MLLLQVLDPSVLRKLLCVRKRLQDCASCDEQALCACCERSEQVSTSKFSARADGNTLQPFDFTCRSGPARVLSYERAATFQPEPSESVLCVLLLYLKVTICQPQLRKSTLRTFVLKSCAFPGGAAKVHLASYFRAVFLS